MRMPAVAATGRARPLLRIYRPGPEPRPASAARVTINGYLAVIAVWSADEWAQLSDPPTDADLVENGCRVALRIEG